MDNYVGGAIMGLIGPFVGYCIYGSYLVYIENRASNLLGMAQVLYDNSATHSGVLAICMLANLGFLFIAMRFETLKAARGLLAVTILYAFFGVYLKFF